MDAKFLANTTLFRGVDERSLILMLKCLKARERTYKKGEAILRAGDTTSEVGLIERGSANIVFSQYWGSNSIFSHVREGELFAESFAAMHGKELPVSVVAAEDTQVLFLNLEKIFTVCENNCPFHARTIKNFARIEAQKNLDLSSRMMHTAPRTIRGRVLSYLSEQAREAGSRRFAIPFSRQQLADYLGVDRSALSNELSKMKRDGILDVKKNEFTLLDA